MARPEPSVTALFDETRHRLRKLTRRIERQTKELARLSLFLLETDDTPPDRIASWLKAQGFSSGPDGQFLPRPSVERFRRGETAASPELAYFWPESLKDAPLLRAHFHALRHLAGPMAKLVEQLGGLPQYIYFHDACNGVITYPHIDSQGIIPPDFDWKTYYPWQVAGPEANPLRSFQWVTPSANFGAQGPFIIGALPIYRDDECLGIWCMDIPLDRLHAALFPVPPPADAPLFVIDGQGRIVLHSEFGPVVCPKDRLLIWKPLALLGGEFAHLDPAQLQAEGRGKRHIVDGDGHMVSIAFDSMPNLNWILIGLAPIPEPAAKVISPPNLPPDPDLFRETLELCISQAQMLKGWEQSYQTLVSRFSAVFFSLAPFPTFTTLYVSPQAEQLFEYSPRDFIDNPHLWSELILPEDLPEQERKVVEFLASGNPYNSVYRIRTRSGAIKWVREEAVLIRDRSGTPQLIQGFLFDITDQKTTEENLRIREFEIRSLSDRLLELQEVERRNISTVLHDHMGQLLTLARLEIEGLKISPKDTNCRNRCLALIDDSLKAVRNLASSLHPPFLDDLELPQIIELVIDHFKYGAHFSISLYCDPALPSIAPTLKTVLYRVVGEALTNVVRHSDARSFEIRLQSASNPPGLALTFRDDGHGFAPAEPRHSGIGLIGMRERIQQVGGEFSLFSTPGVGTQIILFIPLPPKDPHD
jgi:PAS domain S-box-containing protein